MHALLIGRGHSLAWVLPQMLSRAGFSVDVITSSSFMRRAKFVRHCDIVPLSRSLIPTIRRRMGNSYNWIIVTEDGTLSEILESDLSVEEKRKLLPVQGEEHFAHLYSKIGLSRAFKTHGVNTPPFLVIHNREEALLAANQLGYPILLKRDASGGGNGVFPCNSPSDINALSESTFAKPLLAQKKISGFELDLSALYLEGELVHFSYAKVEKTVKNFGPSTLRTYRPLREVDREIFYELKQIGRALGANGFTNIACIQSDRGRFYFETDMRPNAWVEVPRYFGEDPANQIRDWFHCREPLIPPPSPACSSEILIPYFLRLKWFELLINRHNVWKFIPRDDRILTAKLVARAFMASIAKGVIPTKYHQRVRQCFQ